MKMDTKTNLTDDDINSLPEIYTIAELERRVSTAVRTRSSTLLWKGYLKDVKLLCDPMTNRVEIHYYGTVIRLNVMTQTYY